MYDLQNDSINVILNINVWTAKWHKNELIYTNNTGLVKNIAYLG